jgi:hypothetical protein
VDSHIHLLVNDCATAALHILVTYHPSVVPGIMYWLPLPLEYLRLSVLTYDTLS